MREIDPLWTELAEYPFARWLTPGDLKYRAQEIRALLDLKPNWDPNTPVDVEIGAHRGRFMLGLAKARPNASLLGIELRPSWAAIAQRRLHRHGVDAKIYQADAKLLIPIFFQDHKMMGVYMLFPDPWWKKKHAKRRLVGRKFLELLHHHMHPNGWFVLITDVPFHAENLLASLEGLFKPIDLSDIPGSLLWEKSTRERHCQEDGIPVYRHYLKPL